MWCTRRIAVLSSAVASSTSCPLPFPSPAFPVSYLSLLYNHPLLCYFLLSAIPCSNTSLRLCLLSRSSAFSSYLLPLLYLLAPSITVIIPLAAPTFPFCPSHARPLIRRDTSADMIKHYGLLFSFVGGTRPAKSCLAPPLLILLSHPFLRSSLLGFEQRRGRHGLRSTPTTGGRVNLNTRDQLRT